jgi:large subunit ribosomal protein L24
MPGLRIKRGDEVQILSGKDIGSRGRVLDVLPKKKKVIVEGVNRATRHEKLRMDRRGTQQGGISHQEAAIDISKVALICPTDGPTRAGYRVEAGTGAKVRVCKKCGVEI